MTLYAPFLPADFWQLDAEREREQKERATEAETFFKDLHAERMREVDALAAHDNALYTEDMNARRLKDLSSDERETLEAKVSARIAKQLSETPPYGIKFEPKDGWHCKCVRCEAERRRR